MGGGSGEGASDREGERRKGERVREEEGGRVNANMHIFKISHPHNQKMHFFFLL